MLLWLLVTVILAAAVHLIVRGIYHRRRERAAGREVGSLWHHMEQWSRDQEVERKGKSEHTADPRAELIEREREALLRMGARAKEQAEIASQASRHRRSGRSRVKHADDPGPRIAAPRASSSPAWGRFRFKYVDDSGRRTTRTVDLHSAWGERFEGFCELRGELRTFRFDRIVGNVVDVDTGEVLDVEVWRAGF